MALARVQIWSIMVFAKVGDLDPNLACTVVEAILLLLADRLAVDESKGIRLWLGFENVRERVRLGSGEGVELLF